MVEASSSRGRSVASERVGCDSGAGALEEHTTGPLEIVLDNPWHGEALTRSLDEDMPFRENFDRCISITLGGKLLGGVFYDTYVHRSIQIHIATFDPRWCHRRFLRAVFWYPFNQLKVERVYGPIRSTNKAAVDLAQRLGFIEDARLKDAIPDGDLIIFKMERTNCRWLTTAPPCLEGAN